MTQTEPTPEPKGLRHRTKVVLVVALAIGAAFLLWLARGVLAPVIFGALLAYMLAPLIGWLEDRLPRVAAIAVSYLLVVAVGVALFVFVPLVFFNALGEIDFAGIFERIDEWAINFLEAIRTVNFLGVTYDMSAVVDPLIVAIEDSAPAIATSPAALGGFFTSAFAATAGLFGLAVTLISFFVFTLLISMSLAASGNRLVKGGLVIFPERYQPK